MAQTLEPGLATTQTAKNMLRATGNMLTPSLSYSLIIILVSILLAWYIQSLWNKRYLYYYGFKTPGPFPLPFIGNALTLLTSASDIPQRISELSEHYGGIYRMMWGSDVNFVVSDTKYLRKILAHPGALNKHKQYRYFKEAIGDSLVNTLSLSIWKAHRKLILPSFSPKILESFFDIFVEQSELYCDMVKKYSGRGIIDIIDYVERCTFNIILESAMGIKFNAYLEENHEFAHCVQRGFTILSVRTLNILWQSDIIFKNILVGRSIGPIISKCRTFVRKVVEEQKLSYEKSLKDSKHVYHENKKTKSFFLHSLLEITHQENQHFTEEELIDEVFLFIIAGYDTTATAISANLMALGMFPDIQEKCYQEVMEVIGPHRKVQYDDITKLKYCERVVKESLRLFSSFFVGRFVSEDIQLDDKYTIPKGASVLIDLKNASRDPKVWKDPLKFDPDRFLTNNFEEPGYLMAFSFGPRNCIGKRYAMLEILTFLATFIRKYKTHCEYRTVEEYKVKWCGVLKPVNGFKTSIELRSS